MSKRGIDAPLAVQMDHLKKNMQKRDKRRDQDRHQRLVSAAGDDPYAQSTRARSTGGVNLGPGAAAQAAVLNAAALEGPTPIRCDLCEANFRNEAMLRQHEEGPAHKKAVAKDKARREREAWMENPSAAANALQAAVWLNGDGALRQHATSAGGKGHQRYQKQSHGRGAPAGNQAEELVRSRGPTHADLIAQARRANEPISIDGWIPPPLEGATPAAEERDEECTDGHPEEGNPTYRDETVSQGCAEELAVQHQEAATGDAEEIGAGLVAYGESSEEDSDSDSDKPMRKFESFF